MPTGRPQLAAGEVNGTLYAVGGLDPVNATLATVPGTHMSSVTMPDLGRAIVDFLGTQ